MEKIQILFPAPVMRRLRELARREDRPISEIVRRATETWLDRCAPGTVPAEKRGVPVFRGGKVRVASGAMRDAAWQDRTHRVAEGRTEGDRDGQP